MSGCSSNTNIDLISTMTEDELLSFKLCELSISLESTVFAQDLSTLTTELRNKKIRFKPTLYFADDWFVADGNTAVAIPFYLGHPRLLKMEKKHVQFVEGHTKTQFIKFLRHECGHAIDNAFLLRRKRIRQRLFGLSCKRYPNSYSFDLDSRDYVRNIRDGYAQSHPDEDWAETFAVWLSSDKNWQRKYGNWPAFEKLSYMDEVMRDLRNVLPEKECSKQVGSIGSDQRTLKQYYRDRCRELKLNRSNFFQDRLSSVFYVRKETVDAYPQLKDEYSSLRETLRDNSTLGSHAVNMFMKEFTHECKSRKFQLKYTRKLTRKKLMNKFINLSGEFIEQGRDRILM